MSSPDMIKQVENCVRNGFPLMIEDMEENFESMLEPLLTK